METLYRVKRAILDPRTALRFAHDKCRDLLLWNQSFRALREPKVPAPIPDTPQIHEEVLRQLKADAYDLQRYRIDSSKFRRYLDRAWPTYRQARYYGGFKSKVLTEKSLEHYVAADLLCLTATDVYIDIASANSPVAEIYSKLYDCVSYRQDLKFPEGTQGYSIGGDAANMPLTNGFASKMGLHCSFEHFEGDSDTRFIREAGRVLRTGGRLIILPLYLFTEYAIQTDPVFVRNEPVKFEPDAVLYCARGSRLRHGRCYSVPKFSERVRSNLGPLKLTIFLVENAQEIDPACYLRLAAVFEKA